MNYLLNQIGISAIAILFATATCNNSGNIESSNIEDQKEVNDEAGNIVNDEILPFVNDTAKTSMEKRDTIEIVTTMGSITVVLYNETPLHRDNFLKLVNSKFYDSILFHRVIANFMIQTGDPLSKDKDPNNDGSGGPGYRVPAEFHPNIKHKRGALAAARDNNPEKASSGSQFYICHVATNFLDGNYTVFGETISGFDVLDKIATTPCNGERPVKNIMIITCKHLNAAKAVNSSKKSKKGNK